VEFPGCVCGTGAEVGEGGGYGDVHLQDTFSALVAVDLARPGVNSSRI